jgi:site-specific recombinase XerD
MKNKLFVCIQQFFQSYLSEQRGLSQNTINSYKDTIKLLLQYLAKENSKKVSALTLGDINSIKILAFLEALQKKRNNSIRTRNHRLAVMKAFCSFLIMQEPQDAREFEKIILIKIKRMPQKLMTYLTEDEVEAIFKTFDRSNIQGVRDYAIFLLLYNTGARAQEICDLEYSSIHFEKPYFVVLKGKGNKSRQVPLWHQTVEAIRQYHLLLGEPEEKTMCIFQGKRNQSVSRFGLLYLVKSWIKKAAVHCKSLQLKTVGVHTLRHTTAMHLLQSGVDITVIKTWLGHVDLNTTHGYIEINLKMKQQALAKKAFPHHAKQTQSLIDKNKDVLKWINSL